MTPDDFLQNQYHQAMLLVASGDAIQSAINQDEKDQLDLILKYAEQSKGVLSVTLTSIVYKLLNPSQDIRNHQTSIKNGYSGRTFDTHFITPFMKANQFPAMAESGWLTRSLEQKVPYDKQYAGAITPASLKTAFLQILDNVENNANSQLYLEYLLQGLLIQRNKHKIDLAKPTALPIATILQLLELHFNQKYQAVGASRLPVLAIYAAYQALMPELKRFQAKALLPLESHTASDNRSGTIGDIEIRDEKQRAFEAVEIKHGISVTLQLVQDAYEKFKTTPVERYYILSTADCNTAETHLINTEIIKIKNVHGCQLIVNGIMPTLKYYLRLLSNPYEFIEHYVNLLEDDKALKFEHKQAWNTLIAGL
jgi:DNA (cytosine-5)-methyltransferase 1